MHYDSVSGISKMKNSLERDFSQKRGVVEISIAHRKSRP